MSKLKERIPEASESFGKLVMASSSKADEHADEVHAIMTALGLEKRYFISDQSTFSDFGLDDEEYTALAEKLGVEVSPDHYVADVAEAMWLREAYQA